ncbi:MAG: hypothetical protein IPH44_21260 [Myxococcales bacterium]|nr:hypothetical protein [Myxococcales bacterium]
MGKPKATTPATGPAASPFETPDAAQDVGRDAAVSLVGSNTDPLLLGLIIRGNPRHADAIFAYLSEQHGMALVRQVSEYATALTAQSGDGALDLGVTSAAGRLASEQGVVAGPDGKPVATADPKEKLPYDKAGGWDGATICAKLGQNDKLAGTDSDRERCTFAAALAAHVLAGPTACARFLVGFANEHAPKPAKGAAPTMTLRQRAAAEMMLSVASTVGAGTGTFGDLSWAQEAMHAYLTTDEHAGGRGGTDVIVSSMETYEPLNVRIEKIDALLGFGEDLGEGQWLMVSLHCEYDRPKQGKGDAAKGDEATGAAPSSKDYIHQLMLIRQDGRLLIYDSDQPSGQNLWPATSGRLERYLKGDYDAQYFMIQGQVTPKTADKAPT